MDDQHHSTFYAVVPDFIVGAIWLIDFAALVALTNTPTQLRRNLRDVQYALDVNTIPEFAVGFLLILVGVLLPYAVAIMLNPATIELANVIMARVRPFNASWMTSDYAQQAATYFHSMFGFRPPADANATALLAFLTQTRSPSASSLQLQRSAIHCQVALTLPIALLAAIVTYAAVDQSLTAVLVATVVGGIVLFGAIYSANVRFVTFHHRVMLSFCVAHRSAEAGQAPPVGADQLAAG